jgi:hypothetical protein
MFDIPKSYILVCSSSVRPVRLHPILMSIQIQDVCHSIQAHLAQKGQLDSNFYTKLFKLTIDNETENRGLLFIVHHSSVLKNTAGKQEEKEKRHQASEVCEKGTYD